MSRIPGLRITGLMMVFAAVTLGGCSPKQARYSCGTDLSQRTAPQLKVAPGTDKAGDATCE